MGLQNLWQQSDQEGQARRAQVPLPPAEREAAGGRAEAEGSDGATDGGCSRGDDDNGDGPDTDDVTDQCSETDDTDLLADGNATSGAGTTARGHDADKDCGSRGGAQ